MIFQVFRLSAPLCQPPARPSSPILFILQFGQKVRVFRMFRGSNSPFPLSRFPAFRFAPRIQPPARLPFFAQSPKPSLSAKVPPFGTTAEAQSLWPDFPFRVYLYSVV